MVSLIGLKRAFFDGINRFLIEAYADKKKAAIVEARLERMIHSLPFKQAP